MVKHKTTRRSISQLFIVLTFAVLFWLSSTVFIRHNEHGSTTLEIQIGPFNAQQRMHSVHHYGHDGNNLNERIGATAISHRDGGGDTGVAKSISDIDLYSAGSDLCLKKILVLIDFRILNQINFDWEYMSPYVDENAAMKRLSIECPVCTVELTFNTKYTNEMEDTVNTVALAAVSGTTNQVTVSGQ